MIVEVFLNIIFKIVNVLLSPLEVLNFVFDSSVFSTVVHYLDIVFYFIPIGNLMPIVIFIIAMFSFRAIVSLIKTIWQLLPLL